jgi:hypothetical protein
MTIRIGVKKLTLRGSCFAMPIVLLAFIAAQAIISCASPSGTELPDTRTWRFFSEKKVRARLYYAIPSVADSVRVSDDPACCPLVSPNGLWVGCTNFNPKAIESELLILSRKPDQWRPIPGYTVISYQWSPDGVSLAGYAKRRTASTVCFFAVQPQSRAAWFVDSLSVPEDYEFAWDSTSSRVAICRPASGSKTPPRVLVLTVADRKVRLVASLTAGEPTNPRWLADSTLVVTKRSSANGDSVADLRFPSP